MNCEHCTQKIVAYIHYLDKDILKLLYAIQEKGNKADVYWIRQKGFGNNTTRASYFGLVRHIDDRLWELTEEGRAFLNGKPHTAWVKVFCGEVYEKCDNKITKKDVGDTRFKPIDPSTKILEERRNKLFKQTKLL